MDKAGASAKREYERRRARDRRNRRVNSRLFVGLLLATPLAVFGLVHLGALILNHRLEAILFDGAEAPALVDAGTTNLLAVVLAAGATYRLTVDRWGPRRSTEAWRRGFEGEVLTERQLDRLPGSFVVLHDLLLPGRRENVDHVVIGPSGVFTIETKHYSSNVTIRGGRVRRDGRSMDSVVEQSKRQADAVAGVLETPVTPVVCVQGAGVDVGGLFSRPVVNGVRFCTGRQLVRLLTVGGASVDSDQITMLATLAQARLRPAVAQQLELTERAAEPPPSTRLCGCGAPQVLRRRRRDGHPFWGCSRYPACRNTSPARTLT